MVVASFYSPGFITFKSARTTRHFCLSPKKKSIKEGEGGGSSRNSHSEGGSGLPFTPIQVAAAKAS